MAGQPPIPRRWRDILSRLPSQVQSQTEVARAADVQRAVREARQEERAYHQRLLERERVAWEREREREREREKVQQAALPNPDDKPEPLSVKRLSAQDQLISTLQAQLSSQAQMVQTLQARLAAQNALVQNSAAAVHQARVYRELYLEARGTFRLSIRIRPPKTEDRSQAEYTIAPGPDMRDRLTVAGETFALDRVFQPFHTASDVYAEFAPLLTSALTGGCHVLLLVYGRSGTGKSTTIHGLLSHLAPHVPSAPSSSDDDQPLLRLSYTELYRDALYDLLATSTPPPPLHLPGPTRKLWTPASLAETTLHPLSSPADLTQTLSRADKRRTTSATALNATSSRSHAFITLLPHGAGSITFVDLAGHEPSSPTTGTGPTGTGMERTETQYINASLFALASALRRLAARSQKQGGGSQISIGGTWGESSQLLPRIVGGLVEYGGRREADREAGSSGRSKVVLMGTVDLGGDEVGGSLVTLRDLAAAGGVT